MPRRGHVDDNARIRQRCDRSAGVAMTERLIRHGNETARASSTRPTAVRTGRRFDAMDRKATDSCPRYQNFPIEALQSFRCWR
jgi:hypothetical protein